MHCKKCKTVACCSSECQRQGWKDHKPVCQRKEFAGAPCDVCQGTDREIRDTCLSCGFLFCDVCDEQFLIRSREDGEIVNFKRCPGCQQRRRFRVNSDYKSLKNLLEKNQTILAYLTGSQVLVVST
jgi:MYND finger